MSLAYKVTFFLPPSLVIHNPISISTRSTFPLSSSSSSSSSSSCSKHQYRPHRLSCTPSTSSSSSSSSNNSDFGNSGGAQNNEEEENAKLRDQSPQINIFSSNKLVEGLRRYGTAGILSYGLLNTVYYLATFSFVWFYVAPSPGRMGYMAAVERFLKVMAMVWVGSQVTKLVRAAGALALAPLVSRGLTWFTAKLKLKSEGQAFMAIVGVCLGLALLLFFVVTLLWA